MCISDWSSDVCSSDLATAVTVGTSSKAFSNVIDFDQQNSTVSLWYKDNKQDTVDTALKAARAAVQEVGIDHEKITVRLGTGTIALQQAMNNVVHLYHSVIIGCQNGQAFCRERLCY